MATLRERVEADLEAILREAEHGEWPGHPEPGGLPIPGTWIRAVHVDQDARVDAIATPWHYNTGWSVMLGCLSTRCRRRGGRVLARAVESYRTGRLHPASWGRYYLEVSPGRPPIAACRACDRLLAGTRAHQ